MSFLKKSVTPSVPNLFPQGHAIGEAFCNRYPERKRLKNSIMTNEHTVIVAPRRYGKSSLIKQVLIDTKLPGKRLDLLPATNLLFVTKAIKLGFSDLINQISPATTKAKQTLIDIIKKLHPKLSISVFGQKIEATTTQSPEESVSDLLIGLNAAAKKTGKRIVICFDEFQQISLLKDHHSLEAAIRHAVESSTHITYLFSGSSRHLLHQIFSTKSRPLYHLCELMELDRISAETYLPILLEKAKKRWRGFNKENVILEILNLTKCHPYYVNALCRQAWKLSNAPDIQDVQQLWLDYVETQSSWVTDDFARLSPNQRNILAALAYQPVEEPYGNEFSNRVKIGASSIKKSLDILQKNDFTYKTPDKKYRVLDPVVETYLHQIRYFDFLDD